MKADLTPTKQTTPTEVILTVLLVGWFFSALLGGLHITQLMKLPASVAPYVGGALIAYVILSGLFTGLMCVKFMLKKG